MISFLTVIIQKYWTVWLPLLHKYWKVSLPLIFCLFLAHYLITIPFGSEHSWLGIGAIVCFFTYAIMEFFFSQRKSIELVNAYSEKDNETEDGEEPVPSLIRNSLQFSVPKRIIQNQVGKITLTIDSVRSVVKLAKSARQIKNIRKGNFILGISSADLDVSPSEPVNLSELEEQFPISFTWNIKGETLGKKEIKVEPGKEFSTYLGLSTKRSSSWTETIEVVDHISWIAEKIKLVEYVILAIGLILSIPLIVPAYEAFTKKPTDVEEEVEEIEELEALVVQEFTVLKEIKNDERTLLDEEEIQWHLKNLKEYQRIKKNIEHQKKSGTNYKLFWLRSKQYEYDIYRKFRRSYAKILSDKQKNIFCKVGEAQNQLICYSKSFKDSLLVEQFISSQTDTLSTFGFSKLCLDSVSNYPNYVCYKEVVLKKEN